MSESSDPNFEQEAYLNSLRKEMASYLAQKLTFSLFQAGKTTELKDRIADLVEAKLLEDEIPLESEQKEKLISQIIAGMPMLKNDEIVSIADAQDSEKLSLEELQDIIRPYLASKLDDSLFEPERKDDLSEAIQRYIDQKIENDDLPVSDEQKSELVFTICTKMGLTLKAPAPSEATAVPDEAPEAPEAPAESAQPPLPAVPETPTEVVTPAVASPEEEAPFVPAPVAKKKIPKPAAGGMLPLKALTHEIKRDLLYNLSTQINPEIMTSGDELALRAEIFNLIQTYCVEHRFTLSDQDVEKIVLEILSGEGLEFQL